MFGGLGSAAAAGSISWRSFGDYETLRRGTTRHRGRGLRDTQREYLAALGPFDLVHHRQGDYETRRRGITRHVGDHGTPNRGPGTTALPTSGHRTGDYETPSRGLCATTQGPWDTTWGDYETRQLGTTGHSALFYRVAIARHLPTPLKVVGPY